MMKKLEVSSESGISMPIKNLISIVGAVAVGVWAYFGVVERLNRLESDKRLMHKDLEDANKKIKQLEEDHDKKNDTKD